ncbi:MAG: sugar phosphate isomerase/epimerase family protein [Acidimicrobiales bacterium]
MTTPAPDTRLISIAAGVSPELEAAPDDFITAAAAAGWEATGVWFDPETWSDATTASVKGVLDDTGLAAVDMEVVRMGPRGDCGEALVDAAAEVGARNILTISSFDDHTQAADRLATLCQRAEPAGIRVCIEFMRFTAVKTLTDALEVVALADQPNAGILVDLLHAARSGSSHDAIAAVDPALFPYAQWCDGPESPRGWSTRDLIKDAVDDRDIPGEGHLEAQAFESLFAVSVPFSVEVRSKRLRDDYPDPVERARHLLRATAAALTP